MAAEKSTTRDVAYWLLALLVLVGGIVGFYWFQDQAMTVVRAAGLLAAVVVAVFIGAQTVKGRSLLHFFKEADVERRKVVWPTRQETLQTTLIVIVVTIIVSIMLFLFDTLFGWLVRTLIGISGGR